MSTTEPLSALVVDPDATTRFRTVGALAAAGFHVTSASTFETGRREIAARSLAVLVTALKLGEYNGLHLVLRVRTSSPRTACLVTADDSVNIRADVEQSGATYVVEPVSSSEMVAAVLRSLFRTDDTIPIRPPFERRQGQRRQSSLEIIPNRRLQDRRRDPATLLHVAAG